MCSKKVREWLVMLTMEKYVSCFSERGYTTIAQCKQILSSDLMLLGIDDPNHRQLLITGVQLLINSPELFDCHEPCELHFEDDSHELADDFMDSCQVDLPSVDSEPNNDGDLMSLSFDSLDQFALNISASFTCVACPHLKFSELYELDQHIAEQRESNDPSAFEHRYGAVFSSDNIVPVEAIKPTLIMD
ncbi:hypothetical protein AWZ03_006601 [Drosophila navojoa]|uniref:SAM domain-containing protein n=1 Tax=Drosophila navojoa TaxID=7232 RepID=A0A484BG73_DRONA|nr:uncharacterized protein LOC115562593 [Drosophila navojoa]TDG47020.1 hypothetical protein AWZ03_006601 [Drosophila navojoa]